MEILPSNRTELNKSLDAPALDPIMLQIANEAIAGASPFEISQNLGITEDRVVQVLERKDVRTYVEHSIFSTGFFSTTKMVETINTVIEKKIEDAMTTGQFSKKDLLDWFKLIQSMKESTRPKEKTPAIAVQVNNYEQLMHDLKGD